jgi:DNA-binding HxlR family transcriptional regulator
MPEFEYNEKTFQNPVEFVLDQLGGRWKIPILWRLKSKPWRYGELRKDLKQVTHKMLTQQLRELEEDGFIHREVFAVVPPKVEYSLTPKGQGAIPIIETLRTYGITLMEASGIATDGEHKGKD